MIARACLLLVPVLLGACSYPWNDPYPASQREANIFYASFMERPKHLDPVQSYSENEYLLIANIYTPPLQYHYLKRPYELIPFAAQEIPHPAYFDKNDRPLPENADSKSIAYSVYEIHVKPGFKYQPHPAFATNADGRPVYLGLDAADLAHVYELRDFKQTGTRELIADDYVYEIKRLAHPRLHSPIFGLMSEYIIGLGDYAQKLKAAAKDIPPGRYLDLNQYELPGATAVDRYTYRIKVKGKYPQFLYWLAMPFFAPVPAEVDRFYSQPGMAEKNLTLDWYPVGAGPYMMTVNNPNRQMVLERNPNFPGEPYPSEGAPGDEAAGLLRDAGKRMPFIDKVVFSLEKEAIPYWNKFLQGYYDVSGITSDNFDQVIQMAGTGEPQLTGDMEKQGIRLQTAVAASIAYTGFNMLDPVVGRRIGTRAQAASSHLHRDRHGGIHLHLPQWPRDRGTRPDPARHLRLPRGRGRDQPLHVRLGQRPTAAQIDRVRQKAAGRSRLSRWHRLGDRQAADRLLRQHRRGGRREGHDGLAHQAVPADQSATGGAQHRLQPLPGEDAQGDRADLFLGLERRLPGPGELPVLVLRSARQGEVWR
jgi:ABC-type transport system substrate-binding protein